jgi:hypothetical protein
MTAYDPVGLRRPIAELERWTAAMVLWFKPQFLPMPVITIQGGHRRALGWFAWSRWETRDGAILDEINFVPEYLSRDLFDIAETLVHELAHLANYMAGIKDCSSFQYHNRRFRDRALAVGLTCERVPGYGWAKTALSPALRDRVARLEPDGSAFDLFRLPPAPRRQKTAGVTGLAVAGGDRGGTVVVRTPKRKLSKWTCAGECAAAWVASGTELHAECLDCGTPFERGQVID